MQKIILFLVMIVLLISSDANTNDTQKIRFGVFSYMGVEKTKMQYAPLAHYLSKQLNIPVELHVLNHKDMVKKVAKNELDIITTNPTNFLYFRQKYHLSGALATLLVEFNEKAVSQLAGVIVVRKDSHINSLEDLPLKVIATSSTTRMGGFRTQAYELYKAGISIQNEAKKIIQTQKGHDAVVKLLLKDKTVDAAFVRSGTLEMMIANGELNPSEIKVINKKTYPNYPFVSSTPLYPEWPVFAMPHMDHDLVKKVIASLYLVKSDNSFVKDSGIYGYTIPADYLQSEELIKTLRLPPYEEYGKVTLEDILQQYWIFLVLILILLLIIVSLYIKSLSFARKISSLLDNMGDGVYGVDEDGRCIWINPKALDMLGFTKEEVLYKDQHTLFHYHTPDGKPYHESDCPIYKTIHDKKVREVNDYFIKKNKKFFPVSLTVASVDNGNGAIVIFRDITQQKLVHEALVDAKLKAQAANKYKSEFLANMSHEIRTPMNAVIGLSELLEQMKLEDKQKELVEKINGSSKILLGIINNILDYSKIEAGKLQLEYKEFDLHNVVSQLWVIFEQIAEKKGVQLRIEENQDLPALVVGDELRLTQVLSNIISNALKFTPQGEVIITIEVKNKKDKKADISFCIEDSGIGMTQDQVKKLFIPFSQADTSTTRKYGGTGLGLVITKNIVEALGSHLTIKSKPNIGTTVSFVVQLEVIQWEKEKHLKNTDEKISQETFDGVKILVVEDNEVNQLVVKMMLEQVGIEVTIANNGKQGVQEYKKNPNKYDLILMDLQMPIMSGYDATKKIRKYNKNIPIIALTAAAMIEDKQKVLKAGMDEHLGKPIAKKELYKLISQYTSKKINIQKKEIIDFDALRDIASSDTLVYTLLNKLQIQLQKGDFVDIIEQLQNNTKKAHTLIHSLKGVSGNVQANELFYISQNIDKKYKAKESIKKDDILQLQDAINNYIEQVKQLELSQQDIDTPSEHLNKEELKKLFLQIEKSLQESDLISQEKLELFIANIQNKVDHEKLKEFRVLVEDFEFDQALEILQKFDNLYKKGY